MKKIFAILAITVVAMTVCFSSISFSAASRKSPVATTTRPRNTNITHQTLPVIPVVVTTIAIIMPLL